MASRGAVKVAIVGACIALLAAGIIVYSRSQRHEVAAAATQPAPVIAAKVREHDVPIILTVLSTVTALNSATVRIQKSRSIAVYDRNLACHRSGTSAQELH